MTDVSYGGVEYPERVGEPVCQVPLFASVDFVICKILAEYYILELDH